MNAFGSFHDNVIFFFAQKYLPLHPPSRYSISAREIQRLIVHRRLFIVESSNCTIHVTLSFSRIIPLGRAQRYFEKSTVKLNLVKSGARDRTNSNVSNFDLLVKFYSVSEIDKRFSREGFDFCRGSETLV